LMRVSAGTAVALKLLNWKMQEYPTTAYFLQTVDYEDGKYEESCLMGCKFCPLSSSSMGTRDRLSRIIWPAFPRKTLERALLHVHEVGIRRICLQGTRRKESMNALTTALSWISSRVSTPVSVSAWLENIHVFYWESHERYPLQEGKVDWEEYCRVINESGSVHYMLLEFVQNDDPEQFFEDAERLKEIIS